jgi:hypothetical protein
VTFDTLRRSLTLRTRSLLRRASVEQDLDDELAYHVDRLTELHVASGMTAAAARARALRTLGGVTQTKEACRDTWHVRQLDQVTRDVRVSWRSLSRTPGTAIVMVLTLAIGIALTTVMFSIVNGVLLVPPYPDADRLFWVLERTPQGQMSPVSVLNYRDWKRQSTSFAALGSWGAGMVTLGEREAPLPLRATFATAGYFTALGIAPELGRIFRENEEQPGADGVAVLSHQLWTTHFGGAPDVIGRTIRVRGVPRVVVGIMPADATRGDWDWTEIWLPQSFEPANETRDYRSFNVMGRLRPGVSATAAREEMNAIAARLAREYPSTNEGWGVTFLPHVDALVSPTLRKS